MDVQHLILTWERPCGVVANVLDCDIILSEFEFLSPYYIYFWTYTLRKGLNAFIIALLY